MKRRLLSLIMILTLVLGLAATQQSFGASVSAGMSGGSCEVGKTVTVTLTYSGDGLFGATATLNYDSSALTMVGNPVGSSGVTVTANGNTILVDAMDVDTMAISFQFKANKKGNYTITATTSSGLLYSGEEFSCGAVSATVKVTEPPKAESKPPASSSSTSSNTNSGTPNRRGDFTEEAKVEEVEEEPQEKPEQIEVEVGDREYIIYEDLSAEDAPAGFELGKAHYGEWDWEIAVYVDKENDYVLICLQDKESGEKQFFLYDEEKGSFGRAVSLTVDEFIDYRNLSAAAAAAAAEPEEEESSLSPTVILLGVLIAAVACAIALQIVILKKRDQSE